MSARRPPPDETDGPLARQRRGRSGTLLAGLLLGGLLSFCWSRVQRAHRLRLAARSRAVPEPVQRWEAEGGRPLPEPDERADAAIAGSGPRSGG